MKELETLKGIVGDEAWHALCQRALRQPTVKEAVSGGMSISDAFERLRDEVIRCCLSSASTGAEAPASATARVVVNGMSVLLTARAPVATPDALADLVSALYGAARRLAARPEMQSVGVALDERDKISWLKQTEADADADKQSGERVRVHSLRINESRKRGEVVRTVDLFLRPGGEYPDVRVSLPALVQELVATIEAAGLPVEQFVGERTPIKGLTVLLGKGKPKPNGNGHYINYVAGSARYGQAN